MKAPVVTLVALAALTACSHGAKGPTPEACGEGSTVIEGACVPDGFADAFCGPAAKARPGGGCARMTCARGEALDLDHGICLPEASVVPTMLHGAPAEEGDTRESTCLTGTLTSRRGRLDCAAGPRTCGRGERFVPGAADAGPLAGSCGPLPPCGPDAIFDDATARCTRVAWRRGGERVVDVGTFARLLVGTDGGEGANAFCAPVRAAGPGVPHFQVRLTVPDNDVTQASARVVAKPPAATVQADAAERAMEDIVRILHFYGGTALAASVSLEVTCTGASASEPTLEVPP